MSPLVDIRNLSVRYGDTLALCSVDLTIAPGDFVGVIGPNGGGKTTLVKAITGLVTHTGTIDYDDSLRRGGRLVIGYLPQQERFDAAFPLPVSELILSGLQSQKRLPGRYTSADRARVRELMQLCGIEEVARSSVGEISGGQLQRALLCRAIIADPRLLVLDEPSNFVDPRFEQQLHQLLGQLNERMAIVMVSHNVAAISQIAKRLVYVNRHLSETNL